MARHNELGKEGEGIAKIYLQKQGYEILDENWTSGKSEIDLIALKNRIIIFVEVKTRSSAAFGEPEDFVERHKHKQMELAATAYIAIMNHRYDIRFDIIAITFTNSEEYKLNHIEDAFWPQD